jgi:ABC-type multidrug transport system permease subunit
VTVLSAPGSRLRWAVTDSGTLARRYLAHLAHQPEQVVLTVGFPILILVIFVYLLGGMVVVPGGDYRQLLVPGMATMTMLSGVGSTMVAVVTDAQRGITDRLRSLPMAGAAVLAGRALADLAISAIGLVVLLLAGLAIGWRPSAGPLEVAAAVGVLLLLRFALLWVGIYLGLIARGTGPVTAAQALEFPVAFLSGVFVSPAAMPAVVATLAEWNPLTATAAAARELFGNPGWGGGSWVEQRAVLVAVAWPLLIIAVFGPLSVHRYREMSR